MSRTTKRAVIAFAVAALFSLAAAAAVLNHVLSQQVIQRHDAHKEKPAELAGSSIPPVVTKGCWEVRASNDYQLSATWLSACAGVTDPPTGEIEWPHDVIRLPAFTDKEPLMTRALTHATLTDELALEGAGAMLYLPANESGGGYYVAGWVVESDADEESEDAGTTIQRGLVIGRYGSPPPSVAVPSGRVYMAKEFTPQQLRASRSAE